VGQREGGGESALDVIGGTALELQRIPSENEHEHELLALASFAMSSDSTAALQPSVRKQSLDLAGDLDRVKAFVAKFSSMGFMDVSPAPTRAHADHSNCTFVCSDMVSFLFRVEKLCPSREAALYVPDTQPGAIIAPLIRLSGVPPFGKGRRVEGQRGLRRRSAAHLLQRARFRKNDPRPTARLFIECGQGFGS
jgi:hypothetical protein